MVKKRKRVRVRSSFLWIAAIAGLSGNAAIDAVLKAQVFLPFPQVENLKMVDDGDSGFYADNAASVAHAKSFDRDFTYLDATAQARWEFTDLDAGTYNIYATWVPFGANNSAAVYTPVLTANDVSVTLQTITADQRNAPTDGAYGATALKKIGSVTIDAGTLRISLAGSSAFTIADGLGVALTDPRDDIGLSTSSAPSSAAGSAIEYYCNSVWQSTPCSSTASSSQSSETSIVSASDYCGDGIVQQQIGEACDDGNRKPSDGCDVGCTMERCGDGIVTPSMGEECDSSVTWCSNCKWLYCGDFILSVGLGEVCDDGNTLRGDGCNEMCRQEVTVIASSSLSIASLPAGASSAQSLARSSTITLPVSSARSSSSAQQPTSQPSNGAAMLTIRELDIGTSEIVLPGQKNILLKRFEVETRSDTSVQLALMIFGGDMVWNNQNSSGALKMQNYSLYMDTNADGTTDTLFNNKLKADGPAAVSFTNNHTFVGGTKTIFEMRADMIPSVSSIQLGFSFMNVAQPVTALNTANGLAIAGMSKNGVCPVSSCGIHLTTLPPKILRVAQQGSLMIAPSATPVRNRQILAGHLSDELFRMQLRAYREDVSLSTLRLSVNGNGAAAVDHLQLFVPGGTSPVGFAQRTKCANTSYQNAFCVSFNPGLVIPKNGMDLSVRAQIKSDVNGAVSGDQLSIALTVSDGVPVATGRGLTSFNLLEQNSGDGVDQGEVFIGVTTAGPNQTINGTSHTIVLQKILSIANASLDADGTNIPTGAATLGRFRFSAAANANTKNGLNKAIITDLIFTVNTTHVQVNQNSFRLYNVNDASQKIPCNILDERDASGTFHVACWDIASSTVQSAIPLGNSLFFALEGEILDANSSFLNFQNASLQVSLDSFSDAIHQGMAHNLSHIRWLDVETATNAAQEFWWVEHGDTIIRSTSYQN